MPEATRRARVDDLAGLALREPELARTRDVCVTAHRGLLDAETEQARARRSLEAAERRHPDGPVPAGEAQQIADAIAASNRALEQAQQALPRCEAQSRELALRAR